MSSRQEHRCSFGFHWCNGSSGWRPDNAACYRMLTMISIAMTGRPYMVRQRGGTQPICFLSLKLPEPWRLEKGTEIRHLCQDMGGLQLHKGENILHFRILTAACVHSHYHPNYIFIYSTFIQLGILLGQFWSSTLIKETTTAPLL